MPPWEKYAAPAAKPWQRYKAKPSVASDVGRSVVRGLGNVVSATLGMPADAARAAEDVAARAGVKRSAVRDALTAVAGPMGRAMPYMTPAALNNVAGNTYEPSTTAGRYARTAAEFVPNALMGPGAAVKGVGRNALARGAQVVLPAVASEGAGQAAEAMGGNELVQGGARMAGAVVGGVGAGVRIRPRAPKVKPIDPAQLRLDKSAAYERADAAGIRYKAEPFAGLIRSLRQEMDELEADPELHKGVASALRAAEKRLGQSPSLAQVEQLRRVIRDRTMSGDRDDEARLGGKMLAVLDDFLNTAKPRHVEGGDPATAAGIIGNARDLARRTFKVEAVEEAVERAKDRAGASGSGGNVNNAIRAQLLRMKDNEPGLTPAELEKITSIIRGTEKQNALRQVGKLSPEGNGLMQVLHVGGAVATGGASTALGAVGAVAKRAADADTEKQVRQLIQLMASGGQNSRQAEQQLRKMARQPAVARMLRAMAATAPGVAVSVPANAQER